MVSQLQEQLYLLKVLKMKILFGFTLVFLGAIGYSQDGGWLTLPKSNDSISILEKQELDFNDPNGKVVVTGGEKLKTLEEFVRTGEETVEGVKMDGFRVLIFFDQNKSESESQKARFLSRYPDHKAYVDYLAPNYRVRVGNFRTKLEAEALKAEIIGMFPTAIVISDKIQLPQLPLKIAPINGDGNQ